MQSCDSLDAAVEMQSRQRTNVPSNSTTTTTTTNITSAAATSGTTTATSKPLTANEMNDSVLLRMTILSRIIERFRFLIPEENLHEVFTHDSLCWMLALDPDTRKPGILTSLLNRSSSASGVFSSSPSSNNSNVFASATTNDEKQESKNKKRDRAHSKALLQSLLNHNHVGLSNKNSETGSTDQQQQQKSTPDNNNTNNNNITENISADVDDNKKDAFVDSTSTASLLKAQSTFDFSFASLLKPEVEEFANQIWDKCQDVPATTFHHLLTFNSPHFPLTTRRQRDLLRELTNQDVISVSDAAAVLNIVQQNSNNNNYNSGSSNYNIDVEKVRDSDPILKCLFGPLTTLPSFVFSSLLDALSEHPHTIAFSRQCCKKVLQIKTNMAIAIPLLAVFFITLITVPMMDIDTLYLVQRTGFLSSNDDWNNYCPVDKQTGKVNPTNKFCDMIKRDLSDLQTTQDVANIFRSHMVSQLWPDDTELNSNNETMTASEKNYLGNVLVGSLLLKVSPLKDSKARKLRQEKGIDPNLGCPTKSCDDINLSQSIYEFLVDEEFDCSAFNSPSSSSADNGSSSSASSSNSIVVVPFNTTKSEALSISNTFALDLCEEEMAMATLNFAMYQPSQSILAFVTVSTVIPKAGSVIPRTFTSTMNLRSRVPVAILAVSQILSSLWLIDFTMRRYRKGVGFLKNFLTFQNVLQFSLTGIVVAAWIILSSMPDKETILEEIAQDSFFPKYFDQYVAQYNAGMDLLAIFTMAFYISSVSLLSDMVGLSTISRLLSLSGEEVVGMLAIFSVVELCFLCVARVLFGSTNVAFSFSSTGAVSLLKFFWGQSDYAELTAEFPTSGAIFFFLYLLFSAIFVSTLLIATITSSLVDVTARSNLHEEIYRKIRSDASNFSEGEERWFDLRTKLFALSNILLDALAFTSHSRKWIEFSKMNGVLYERFTRVDSVSTTHQVLEAAVNLIKFCQEAEKENVDDLHWNTTLRRAVSRYKPFVHERDQWIMIEKVILSQTRSNLFRDSVLVRVFISFDQNNSDIDEILNLQNKQRKLSAQKAFEAAASPQLSAEHQQFHASFTKKMLGVSSPVGSIRSLGSTSSPKTASFASAASSSSSPNTNNYNNDNNDKNNSVFATFPTVASGSFSTSTGAQPLLMPTTNSNSPSSPTRAKSKSRGRNEKLKSSSFDIHARDLEFIGNAFILRKIKAGLYFPVICIACLAFYLALMIPVLNYRETTTFLSHNLKALFYYSYQTYCDDDECSSGLMHTKNFKLDTDNIDELEDYFERNLIPMLFTGNESLPFSVPKKFLQEHNLNQSFAVLKDEYIRRTSPIHVRQLRAIPTACDLPSSETVLQKSSARRAKSLSEMKCYEEDGFSSDSLPQPQNSLLPTDAYEHKEYCIENNFVIGDYRYYPCSGYSVDIHNKSQLRYLINGQWLDSATKLVVISSSFKSTYTDLNPEFAGRVLDVRIDCYTELAIGGGSASVFCYTTPRDNKMWEFALPAFVFMSLEILYFLYRTIETNVRWYSADSIVDIEERFHEKTRAEHHSPLTPWITIITLLWIIVAICLPSISTEMKKSHILAALITNNTGLFIYYCLLPIGKYINNKVAYLDRVIKNSLLSTLTLLPFYVIISLGLIFSGHVLFGRNCPQFSTLTKSLQTVGRAILFDVQFQEIFDQRPLAAVLFTVALVAIVLTVLSNLLVSIMTYACEMSKATIPCVNMIRKVADFGQTALYTDEFVEIYLSWYLVDDHPIKTCWRSLKSFMKKFTDCICCSNFCFGDENHDDDDDGNHDHDENNLSRGGTNKTGMYWISGIGGLSPSRSKVLDLKSYKSIDEFLGEGILENNVNDNDNNNDINSKNSSGAFSPSVSRSVANFRINVRNELLGKKVRQRRQFAVTSKGRIIRPSEILALVIPSARLIELADCLKLTTIPEQFLLSIALFVARTDYFAKQTSTHQSTYDEILEAEKTRYGFNNNSSSFLLRNMNSINNNSSSNNSKNNSFANNNATNVSSSSSAAAAATTSSSPNYNKNNEKNMNEDKPKKEEEKKEKDDQTSATKSSLTQEDTFADLQKNQNDTFDGMSREGSL